MSETTRKSVSLKTLKIVEAPEGIFLQPIDQHYEKLNKSIEVGEVFDQSKFFEEYGQSESMKDMLTMLEKLDVSTDSDSLGATRENSFKKGEEGEKGGKKEDRSPLQKSNFKVKSCLNENWQKSIETFISQQKSMLRYLSLSNQNSPYVNRSRAYSNCVPISKFSYSEGDSHRHTNSSSMRTSSPFVITNDINQNQTERPFNVFNAQQFYNFFKN